MCRCDHYSTAARDALAALGVGAFVVRGSSRCVCVRVCVECAIWGCVCMLTGFACVTVVLLHRTHYRITTARTASATYCSCVLPRHWLILTCHACAVLPRSRRRRGVLQHMPRQREGAHISLCERAAAGVCCVHVVRRACPRICHALIIDASRWASPRDVAAAGQPTSHSPLVVRGRCARRMPAWACRWEVSECVRMLVE
jgi:hypothetical protein